MESVLADRAARDRSICRRYKSGESVASIAKDLVLTRARVYQILDAHDVERRPVYKHIDIPESYFD